MTIEEFMRIAAVIKTAYPNSGPRDTEGVEIWYRMLKDIDYRVADVCLARWVANNKWPPTIADIREMAAKVTEGETPDWGEGWQEVKRAIAYYGWPRQKEALESMSEITRSVVERMGWLTLCQSENEVADRANFRVMYEAVAKRKTEDSRTPLFVTELAKQYQIGGAKVDGIGVDGEKGGGTAAQLTDYVS